MVQMERKVDVKTFMWKDRLIERQTEGKTIERQTEGKIDKGKDRQIENRHMERRVDRKTDRGKCQRPNGQTNM